MDYLKSMHDGECISYYAVKSVDTFTEDSLLVREFGSGNYSIMRTFVVHSKAQPCTKEEFETAYDNAINSFMPFLDK